MKLTQQEELSIELLKKVARHWPETLWLFAADGVLHVMKKGEDGKRVHSKKSGGLSFDQASVVETIDIEADGGDW